MKMQMLRATALAATVFASSVAAAQVGSISGTIIDRNTRQPIVGVLVSVSGANIRATTMENGVYTLLNVPTGVRTLEASRDGYRTVEVAGVTVNSSARRRQDFELVRDNNGTPTPPPTLARPPRVEPGVVGGVPGTRPPVVAPPRVEPGVVTLPSSARPMVEPGTPGGMMYEPAQDRGMPSFENMLFPPELVMQHQRTLDLTAEQRRVITEAVKALQNQTIDLQWNLQAEQQALVAMLEKRPINEQAAVAQMAKLVDLEDAVKRTHLATLIKIKNTLTDKQINDLNSLRRSGPGRFEYPPPPERRDWEPLPPGFSWNDDLERRKQ